MKLMKHIMIALVLCAVPAAVVGQVTTSCTDCTHVAPIYMGSGGFIATATDGTDKVTWFARCGGVIRDGELMANDDGMVSALWSADNGLACMAEAGGSFEIGPVMDGGWFWVTDEKNSAVGNLVRKDVLDNDAVRITSAGDGVTMTAGKGAVYLKEKATGRVGVLLNILPEKPPTPLRKCGYTRDETSAEPPLAEGSFKKVALNCALGDGGLMPIAEIVDPATGARRRIPDNGSITRPAGSGELEVYISIWLNGTGHYVASTRDARWGQVDFRGTSVEKEVDLARLTRPSDRAAMNRVQVGSGPGRQNVALGLSAGTAGVSWGAPPNTLSSELRIKAHSAYCGPNINTPLPVKVLWTMADSGRQNFVPYLATAVQPNFVAEFNFTVVCPSGSGAASAHQGRELVPGTPFPVE